MRQSNFEITTSPEAQSSKTGTPRGGLGFATPGNSPHLAERLASRSPADVDSRLVSSAQRCGVELKERYDPVSRMMVMRARVASPAEVDAVFSKFVHAMTPPTRDQSEAWIAELSVITARREDDAGTEALRLTAYSSRLADYPADVVKHALLSRRWKFFPSWAELADACDELVLPRRRMMRALDEAERRADEPAQPENESQRITAEKAEAIMKELSAKLGRIDP